MKRLSCWFLILAGASLAPAQNLVQSGSPMRYLGNSSDPGIGMSWTNPGFDDSSWETGGYGVGYDVSAAASRLFQSTVSATSVSVYTRATFYVEDAAQVSQLLLGADYDDGFAAWVNGVEVYRSAEMPAGALSWNSSSSAHESSNGATPDYGTLHDISSLAIPVLQDGANVLAIGAWNTGLGSSDMVLVPRLVANPGPAEVVRGPYLQLATPTSMIVRWRTDNATDSQVRVGDSLGAFSRTITLPGATTEHSVLIDALSPDTTYYYTVGATGQIMEGGGPTHSFTTPQVPAPGTSFRTWILGDSGTANVLARAVRNAYYDFAAGSPADLWLMLGDNAYPDGTDGQYQEAVFDIYHSVLWNTPLFSTLGNHDARSANSSTQTGVYYDIFDLPAAAQGGGMASGTEAYYSFDWGDVHFVCLDSEESDRTLSGPMLTWLASDLAATTRSWIIAFWHHPPYTKGSHDSDTESKLIDMRENAVNLLEDWGVDLVFTGHSHSYERTFLIDGHYDVSSTFGSQHQVDGGDGRIGGDGAYQKAGVAPHEGAVYVVAGSSGQIGGGNLDHPAMFQDPAWNNRGLRVLGSVILDVTPGRIDLQFLDNTGSVEDWFTIDKASSLPNVDLVTGLGPDPSAAPRVQAWDLLGAAGPFDFNAYGTGGYGANVGAGNLDGTGTAEILSGPGESAAFGPQVRAFFTPAANPVQKINFYAYGTLKFGVRAEGADLDDDGSDEILSGPGPGAVFGPHVRGWNWDGGTFGPIGRINFFSFSTLRFGVRVGGGSVDTDAFAEIVTGAGPGAVFGAAVKGFDYDVGPVSAIAKLNFFAYSNLTFGTEVALADVEGDGITEILTGPGAAAGNPSRVRGFDYDGTALAGITGLDFTAYGNQYGILVGGGDVDADGMEEILTMPADPTLPANGKGWDFAGGSVTAISTLDFVADPSVGYGGNIEAEDFGF